VRKPVCNLLTRPLFVGDARDADIIKTLVSEQTKMIERKGIDAVPVANYARTIFASNHDHVLRIDAHDRRFVSLHVALPPDMVGAAGATKRRAYFVAIIEQMNSGGREALLYELLNNGDVGKFNPEAIPQTEELSRQKLLSASPGDLAIIELAQDGVLPGAMGSKPWMARSHLDNSRAGLFDHIKRHGGRALEHASDNLISEVLKKWGFEKKRLTAGNAWQAPDLTELRGKIRQMYSVVEWTTEATEWGEGDDKG
jgi:Family of unknown function (DUF5906)